MAQRAVKAMHHNEHDSRPCELNTVQRLVGGSAVAAESSNQGGNACEHLEAGLRPGGRSLPSSTIFRRTYDPDDRTGCEAGDGRVAGTGCVAEGWVAGAIRRISCARSFS